MGTIEILKAIKQNNTKDLLLKSKDIETGKILGYNYNYVDEEELFIFMSNTGEGTCSHYLHLLECESHDKCWDSYTDYNNLTDEELVNAKYDVVTGLNTRVYVYDKDYIITNYNKSFEITGIEITEDSLILLYTSKINTL